MPLSMFGRASARLDFLTVINSKASEKQTLLFCVVKLNLTEVVCRACSEEPSCSDFNCHFAVILPYATVWVGKATSGHYENQGIYSLP